MKSKPLTERLLSHSHIPYRKSNRLIFLVVVLRTLENRAFLTDQNILQNLLFPLSGFTSTKLWQLPILDTIYPAVYFNKINNLPQLVFKLILICPLCYLWRWINKNAIQYSCLFTHLADHNFHVMPSFCSTRWTAILFTPDMILDFTIHILVSIFSDPCWT